MAELCVSLSNPHGKFYVWQEIAVPDSQSVRDFSGAALGSARIIQIYTVDATCAQVLRAGDVGTVYVKFLCDRGGAEEPDLDGFEITVVRK